MAEAKLIDGKAAAARLRQRVGAGVGRLVEAGGPRPGLATVLVGEAEYGKGVGRTKKEAELKAAAAAWKNGVASRCGSAGSAAQSSRATPSADWVA